MPNSNSFAAGFLPMLLGLFFILVISTVCLAQDNSELRIASGGQNDLAESIRQHTLELIEAINNQHSRGWRDIALKGEHPAIGVLNRLIEVNGISSMLSSSELYLLERTDGTFEIRNLYVTSAGSGSLNHDELLLRFNSEAQLIGADVAPDLQNYQLVLDRKIPASPVESKRVKEVLDRFLELIKAKDAETLRNLLADDAHLVSGLINGYESGKPLFRYVKRSGDQYVDELVAIDGKLDMSYSQFESYVHPEIENIYSATFRQRWETQKYTDVGYVTLMIDLRDGSEPVIHTRKWQEHPFQTGKLQINIDRVADLNIPATSTQLKESDALAKVVLHDGNLNPQKKGLAGFFQNNKRWIILSAATSATLSIGAAILLDGGESGLPLPPGRPAMN